MLPLLLFHELRQLGLRIDKVRVEAPFIVKVNLGLTPNIKPIFTF